MDMRIARKEVTVEGRPTVVHEGGQGEPLLLIHGGWGDAWLHWAPIWERLALHHRVIAPDLPGIGRTEEPGLGSLAAYSRWLSGVLDAVGAERAWCVGNSFGAAVAWDFAGRAPERCLGLVLVNGTPMPDMPPLVRRIASAPLARKVLHGLMRKASFSPSTLERAFVHPQRAPTVLHDVFRHPAPPQLDAINAVFFAGGSAAPSAPRPLIVWGERDRLVGGDVRAAKRLHTALPGSRLVLIPEAGHLPQVENPEAFVEALTGFIAPAAEASAPAPRSEAMH